MTVVINPVISDSDVENFKLKLKDFDAEIKELIEHKKDKKTPNVAFVNRSFKSHLLEIFEFAKKGEFRREAWDLYFEYFSKKLTMSKDKRVDLELLNACLSFDLGWEDNKDVQQVKNYLRLNTEYKKSNYYTVTKTRVWNILNRFELRNFPAHKDKTYIQNILFKLSPYMTRPREDLVIFFEPSPSLILGLDRGFFEKHLGSDKMLDYIFDGARYSRIDSEKHNSPMAPVSNQGVAGLFSEWCKNKGFSDPEKIIKYIERSDKSTTLGRLTGLPFDVDSIIVNLLPLIEDESLRERIKLSVSLGFEDKTDLKLLLLSLTTRYVVAEPLPELDLKM